MPNMHERQSKSDGSDPVAYPTTLPPSKSEIMLSLETQEETRNPVLTPNNTMQDLKNRNQNLLNYDALVNQGDLLRGMEIYVPI